MSFVVVKLPYLICQISFTLQGSIFPGNSVGRQSQYSTATKAINVISGFALKSMQDIIICHMCVTGSTELWPSKPTGRSTVQNVKMCCIVFYHLFHLSKHIHLSEHN